MSWKRTVMHAISTLSCCRNWKNLTLCSQPPPRTPSAVVLQVRAPYLHPACNAVH